MASRTRSLGADGVKNLDRGSSSDERDRARERERRNPGDRDPPAAVLGQDPGDDPPAEPADGVARDVQAHGAAEVGRVDLLGEVGHRGRGHPGEGEPLEHADPDEHGQARRQRRDQAEHRGGDHGDVMTSRRPQTSDSELIGMIATASANVPADIARLAAAGLAPNARDSKGSSGCGVYSSAKVARPAANSPSRTRRIPGIAVPESFRLLQRECHAPDARPGDH